MNEIYVCLDVVKSMKKYGCRFIPSDKDNVNTKDRFVLSCGLPVKVTRDGDFVFISNQQGDNVNQLFLKAHNGCLNNMFEL